MITASLFALLVTTAPAPAPVGPAPAAPAVNPPALASTAPTTRTAALAVLGEALEILHEQDNTAELLQRSMARFDESVKLGLPAKEKARALAFKSLALLRLGDLEKREEAKLKLYEGGRAVAEEAIAADASSAEAHFYRGANMGRWGQTKGVLNALFLLGDVRSAFNTALKLDPNHADARLALGRVDEEVPGLMGGSRERAEAAYRKAIEMDPRFTRAMLDLAEFLKKQGRKEEAKQWIDRVRAEQNPSKKGEHRKFDLTRAEQLAQGL